MARRLVDRRHRVTVIADAAMAEEVRSTRAAYLPWTGNTAGAFATIRDWEMRTPTALARGIVDAMITGPAAEHAHDVTAAFDVTRPDLVVASFVAFGAMIAAEAAGLPFDVLMPSIYPLPALGMPQGGAGLAPARGPLGRLRDRVLRGASPRMVDHYALARINALRAEYRLEPLSTTWDQVHHARRQLVLTSSAFDFPAILPDNARYVGPILDDPGWAADTAWTPPPGDDPLVLVAMSSTFQNHVDCLQRIVDALSTLPVRALVTTGPLVRPDEIRAHANVTVVGSAPHCEVMRHARLVVTHGGHGTVIKTLAAGLPLVILHHGRDQADNAVRVTERGAGVAVSRRAPARAIAKAVTEVLGAEHYRVAAALRGHKVAGDAASGALLAELES